MTRRGVALLEALLTLGLSLLVLSSAAGTLTRHARWVDERRDAQDASQIVVQAVDLTRGVVARAVRPPTLLGDTAVQVAAPRFTGRLCELRGSRAVVAAPVIAWSNARAGDSIAVTDSTGTEWRSQVVASAFEPASSACPTGGVRLDLTTALAGTSASWLPVRVWRTLRYVLYRGTDGAWWLGERTCAPSCGPAQPAVGPLRPPSEDGWRVRLALSLSGQPVAIDLNVRARVGRRSAAATARLPLASRP